jgi:hypothetical protein
VALTKVEPLVVAEIVADAALHAGAFRHPVRLSATGQTSLWRTFLHCRGDAGPRAVDPHCHRCR